MTSGHKGTFMLIRRTGVGIAGNRTRIPSLRTPVSMPTGPVCELLVEVLDVRIEVADGHVDAWCLRAVLGGACRAK